MERLAILLAFTTLLGPAASAQGPDPSELSRLAEEGQTALSERRWNDAARVYERLRELSPETAEIHAQLGAIRFQQHDCARALPALREGLRLKPDLPRVDTLVGICLSELGRYEEALPILQGAFEKSPDPGLRRLAGLQLQRACNGLGRDGEAAEVAFALTRLHPEDPEVLYHAGKLISHYAYQLTMRLADVAPTSVWMHLAAGEANESIRNFDGALEDYSKVVTLEPNRPGIHFRIGRVHLARARPPHSVPDAELRAAEAFESELRIDPTNANAAYELGELVRQAGDLDRARQLFTQAIEHYPDFEPGLVGLGRVLIAQGLQEQALAPLEKAVVLDPDDEVAFFHLWQAHRALGHEEEQKRYLAEFQRLRNLKREEERRALLRQHVVTQQELEEEMAPQ